MSSIVHEHGRGCWLSWALCWDHSIIYFVLIEMKVRVLGPTAFTLIRFMPLIAFLRESGLMKVLIAFLRENGLMTVLVAFLRESGLRRGIRFPEMWFYKIYIYMILLSGHGNESEMRWGMVCETTMCYEMRHVHDWEYGLHCILHSIMHHITVYMYTWGRL